MRERDRGREQENETNIINIEVKVVVSVTLIYPMYFTFSKIDNKSMAHALTAIVIFVF